MKLQIPICKYSKVHLSLRKSDFLLLPLDVLHTLQYYPVRNVLYFVDDTLQTAPPAPKNRLQLPPDTVLHPSGWLLHPRFLLFQYF